MECRKCKKDIPENSKFCSYCGHNQVKERSRRVRMNGEGTVFQTPNGKWRVEIVLGYYMENEKRKRKIVTKSGFKTKKEAMAYIPFLKQQPENVKPNIRFKELYDEWLPKHELKVSKSTIDCYKSAFKYYESVYFVPFCDIKTKILQDCLDSCDKGRRTHENMKALGTLLYKYAMQNDIVQKNYAEFLYLGNTEVTEEREKFEKDEVEKLEKSTHPYAAYALCLIYTGMRPNELLKLKKEDYKTENDISYFIGGSKTKKGKNRTITISPKIKPYIDRLSEKEGYIFSDDGISQMSQKKFREHFYDLLESEGIKKKAPYCCRHTFASLMKKINAPQTDKKDLMGHESFEMTAHYTHTDLESLAKITNNI